MARCGSSLPLVRAQSDATPAELYAYTRSMQPLVAILRDGGELTTEQAYLLETRFLPMIDAAESDGRRLHRWDKWLFFLGFASSLFVTVIAAVLQSSYLGRIGSAVISTSILVVSSLGTATVALRERLKFKEQGDIAQQLSTFLQKITINFFSRTSRYRHELRSEAFVAFSRDVENAKRDMDMLRLSLTDDSAGAGASAGVGVGPGVGAGTGVVGGASLAPAAMNVATATPPSAVPNSGVMAGSGGGNGAGVAATPDTTIGTGNTDAVDAHAYLVRAFQAPATLASSSSSMV
jgi:hypothetical protein